MRLVTVLTGLNAARMSCVPSGTVATSRPDSTSHRRKNVSWPAVTADAKTATDGTATVRFALPGTEPAVATLSVTVEKDGVTETVVRPVPLAGRLVLRFRCTAGGRAWSAAAR